MLATLGFATKAGLALDARLAARRPQPGAGPGLGADVRGAAVGRPVRHPAAAHAFTGAPRTTKQCAPCCWPFGLPSHTVAAVLLVMQCYYKRLLAYSSIEHMGIMTFAASYRRQPGHRSTLAPHARPRNREAPRCSSRPAGYYPACGQPWGSPASSAPFARDSSLWDGLARRAWPHWPWFRPFPDCSSPRSPSLIRLAGRARRGDDRCPCAAVRRLHGNTGRWHSP